MVEAELYGRFEHDVTFLVTDGNGICIRFPANKLLLSLESPVFSSMFNGDFKEAEQKEIPIVDLTPEVFHNLLQFLIRRKPLNLSKSNVAYVADLLYAAEKYAIEDLKSSCLECLKTTDVNFDNFWKFFTIACLYPLEGDSQVIKDKTLKFLDNNINDLIVQSDFISLNKAGLMLILDRNLETLSMEIVFQQVLTWARMECFRQSKTATPENMRDVMGDIIYAIGFIQMPFEKFTQLVLPSQILTKAEVGMFRNAILKGNVLLSDPWKIKSIKKKKEPQSSTNSNVTASCSNTHSIPISNMIHYPSNVPSSITLNQRGVIYPGCKRCPYHCH